MKIAINPLNPQAERSFINDIKRPIAEETALNIPADEANWRGNAAISGIKDWLKGSTNVSERFEHNLQTLQDQHAMTDEEFYRLMVGYAGDRGDRAFAQLISTENGTKIVIGKLTELREAMKQSAPDVDTQNLHIQSSEIGPKRVKGGDGN